MHTNQFTNHPFDIALHDYLHAIPLGQWFLKGKETCEKA